MYSALDLSEEDFGSTDKYRAIKPKELKAKLKAILDSNSYKA
jgi:sugar-specific transcriptional regulator TrmB